ncbi:MAG: DsbA family oxidoreductase [Pseudomonadota bacterium]
MTVAIEMVSDLVCPWCWLGLRRLQAGRALAPEVETEIYFRPYELDPTIPAEGVDYRDYMTKKFGGVGAAEEDPAKNRWRAMREALERYGEDEDIPFDFEGLRHRPNTMKAHRVVHWAQGQGLGAEVKEAIFAAYFRDHKDIGDTDVLADLAEDAGLDRDIILKLLSSDADHDHVKREAATFMQMGVAGVPTFIADRRMAVQGAESAEKIAKMIRAAAKAQPQERPASAT